MNTTPATIPTGKTKMGVNAPSSHDPKSVWRPAILGGLLLWLAFPPIGWWPLAWLAPLPMLWLAVTPKLPGRRPYRTLYFCGWLYWLATFYFIPLPHPALWLGWLIVCGYLAFYTPIFVWTCRCLCLRWKVPLVIAAPIAWTGTEWIRCHFLTGMGLVCLSHSQYRHPILIQCADWFGAYTLTFAIMALAAALFSIPVAVRRFPRPTGWMWGLPGSALVIAILVYGQWTLNAKVEQDTDRRLVVGLIQGSIDTRLGESQAVLQEKFDQYTQLTYDARLNWKDLDVVVWPESNYPILDIVPTPEEAPSSDRLRENTQATRLVWEMITGTPKFFDQPVSIITGGGSLDPEERYLNAALLLDNNGRVTHRYFKNHRVLYGEYFPVLNWLPIFDRYMPGIDAGTDAIAFELNQVKLAPLICFETTVPHFVRKQLNRLRADGQEPDALINLTNDGWFYGTSCLDFHLACNVFRAVEMRKPNLVCANTGFSADIDACGRLIQVGPRRDVQAIRAMLVPERRFSPYREWGHWIPAIMALVVIAAMIFGWSANKGVKVDRNSRTPSADG